MEYYYFNSFSLELIYCPLSFDLSDGVGYCGDVDPQAWALGAAREQRM